ncbi:MAG: acyl-CoA dehydrogenase family protein [Actinomycetota bacterium]|jgi:alkylation response protein AidB-like acyl-CoA dehydrogenase
MPVDVDPDVADLLAGTVADVVRRAVGPAAAAADEDGRLPESVVEALRSAGLLGLPAEPAELAVTAAGHLATGSAAAALLCVAATAAAACGYTGGVPVAFVDGGGGTPVKAVAIGGGWELTGSATAEWVTGANAAAAAVVVAAGPDGTHRAFAVDPASTGVSRRPAPGTAGLRAAGRGALVLDRAPAALIGDSAAVAAARSLWLLGLGATATGVARAALDLAGVHLQNRIQFRTPLSRLPALRATVADLDRDLCAAEAAVTAATRDLTRAAGAARTAAEVAVRATGEAIQLHGGYGYIVDTGVERLFRDALSIRARVLGAVAPAGAHPVERLLGPA